MMRDRLIELIEKAKQSIRGKTTTSDLERNMLFAESLLEHGVIVPPCKVDDRVWYIPLNGKITETTVEKIVFKKGGLYLKLSCNSFYETSCRSIGKTVFFTREEAEQKLKEVNSNA